MNYAMEAVEKGESVRKAAELYGVPRSTLSDKLSGKQAQMPSLALHLIYQLKKRRSLPVFFYKVPELFIHIPESKLLHWCNR